MRNVYFYLNELRPQHARVFHVSVCAVVLLAAYTVLYQPTCRIRLDTGDRRYFWFGIQSSERLMEEPMRSQLLQIASRSNIVRPEWRTVPITEGSNNVAGMISEWYREAGLWGTVSPQVGQKIVENVAAWVRRTGGESGLPENTPFWMSRYEDWQPLRSKYPRIDPAFRQDKDVMEELRALGYVEPTTLQN